jgi:hypothetical protein
MDGHYEVGWHSGDIEHVHVTFVLDDNYEDLFDVTLYSMDVGNEEDGAFIESRTALEFLIKMANRGRKENHV